MTPPHLANRTSETCAEVNGSGARTLDPLVPLACGDEASGGARLAAHNSQARSPVSKRDVPRQDKRKRAKFTAGDGPEADEFTVHVLAAVAQCKRKITSDRAKAALAEVESLASSSATLKVLLQASALARALPPPFMRFR